MLNQKDILQTQDMIDKRHLDIRTITMGISLLDCCDPDLKTCCDKIYRKITRCAKDLVKVGEDIEEMKFNTAIAQMMTLVNEMVRKGSVTRGEYKALLLVLSPVAPHVCEEIWQLQGFGTPIYTQPWPAYDPAALIKDEVEIAIQVNGKIKGRIMVPASLTREQGDTLREHEAVKAAVGDKQIVKFIFVPGRLLNIVVK